MRVIVIGLLTSCVGGHDAGCPSTPYQPTGAAVEAAEDCEVDADLCAFFCETALTCSGELETMTCEPCSDLAGFAEGECDACGVTQVDGAESFICAAM